MKPAVGGHALVLRPVTHAPELWQLFLVIGVGAVLFGLVGFALVGLARRQRSLVSDILPSQANASTEARQMRRAGEIEEEQE